MQAALLFVLFGFLSAAIGAIVSTGSTTTQQLTQSRQEEMAAFVKNVQKGVGALVDQNMASIPQTSCNGRSYTQKHIQPYLCQGVLSQFVTWGGAARQEVLDPWNNPITGVVAQGRTAILGGFFVPETVYAIVSPGPDRRLGATLQANITAMRNYAFPTTQVNLRLVKALSNDPAETNGADDIVYVFSDLPFIEKRWARIDGSIKQIAESLLRRYRQQFIAFKPAIDLYNQSNGSIVSGGQINLSGAMAWRSAPLSTWAVAPYNTYTRPRLLTTSITNATQRASLGVDDAFDLIRDSRLSLSVSSNTGDIMQFELSNNGSPWGDATGQLSYVYNVDTTKVVQ